MFKTGLENWIERDARQAVRLRVGLLSHNAAVDARGASSLDLLLRAGIRPVALFGPEHGYAGVVTAGEHVGDMRHPDLDIPIHSLYGETRRPRPEWLAPLEVLVVDLQDLGVRCYTYLSTLCETLIAASGTRLRVVVTDRPVPLPNRCDGPMLDPAFESFVARFHAPLVTGMTPGEAARGFVRKEKLDVDLDVAPMSGYRRPTRRGTGWPAWRNPSPSIRSWSCAMTYPATVWTEALPALDTARDTSLAFRVLGAPGLNIEGWMRDLRAIPCAGVEFRPCRYRSKGRQHSGIRLVVTNPRDFAPVETAAILLSTVAPHLATPLWDTPGTRPEWFDALAGTDTFRLALQSGVAPESFASQWKQQRSGYQLERDQVLLYR